MKKSLRWAIGDAIDEFAHRRLGFGWCRADGQRPDYTRWFWRVTPFPLLCNRREMREATVDDLNSANTTSNSVNVQWTGWRYTYSPPR